MQNDSFILTLIASLALEVLFGVTTFQFFYIRQKSVPVFKKYNCRILPVTLKGMPLLTWYQIDHAMCCRTDVWGHLFAIQSVHRKCI